jgi:SAM-dependent methyltransferase
VSGGSAIDDRDREKIVGRYAERYQTFGVDIRTLNPGTEERHRLQHEVHASAAALAGQVVLDVGCGLAHYYAFLKEKGLQVSYIGYDIVPQFIETNRERYPEAHFELRDITTDGIVHQIDWVVMCQVFNNRYEHVSNLDVVKNALTIAFKAAREGLSIDMLSSYVNYEEPHLNYFPPEEMFAFAKTLTPYVTLRHDYLPFHFTLIMYKEPRS